MALRPKHRREIRDLLRVLLDDKVWQPHHTDRLLGIIRACRSDVAEDIEKRVASDYAAQQRETLAIRRKHIEALREVDAFREALKGQHAKIEMLFEALLEAPMAKAAIRDPETGEIVGFDATLIDDKTAKVALSASDKLLRVTGAFAPTKVEAEVSGGGTFDLLDIVEADVEEEAP